MSTRKLPPDLPLLPMPRAAQTNAAPRRFQVRWHDSNLWEGILAESIEAAVIEFAKRHRQEFPSRALVYARQILATEPIRYAIYNTQDGKIKANGPNGILFSK